ncbi:DUF937 domain-containing protein [Methyloferula stellata]|uniref:DUF937 domain-containing protein n=1 Tax=Methyloferula stellata TaxID=876270 RepID=UPI0003703E54|nr:DUF937 domain-containing protein [Methyloferula stellata]
MFSLNEIFQNAQGGKAAENLAAQFGLSTEQVDAAVKALIPALSMAFLSKLKDPGALGSLVSNLSDGQHTSTFASADAAQTPETAAKGGDILGELFGSSHITTQIAQQASSVTGLRPEVLVQMLPVIVSVIAGGLATSLKNQGLGGLFSQLASGAGAQGQQGGLMGMLSSLFGSLFGGQQGLQGGLDSLSKILQPGTPAAAGLQDEIGKILSSRRQ